MRNNHKTIFGIIIGILIGAVISVSAASILKAIDVLYDNSNTGLSANVNDALDETYQKALSLSERVQKLEDSMLTLDKIYPIGSIYISTDLKTPDEVASRFGGTWESYGQGKTLVGNDGTNYITGDSSKGSGGSSTATLTTSNLPNHTHVIPSLSATTSENGSHNHGFAKGGRAMVIYTTSAGNMDTSSGFLYNTTGWFAGANKDISTMNYSGTHTHTISTPQSNTTTCTNCSAQSFSIQNPYTVVYIYKRVE